ncbi:hypothetical protein GGI35DRAFT_429924 [Trichoderma velutinum]
MCVIVVTWARRRRSSLLSGRTRESGKTKKRHGHSEERHREREPSEKPSSRNGLFRTPLSRARRYDTRPRTSKPSLYDRSVCTCTSAHTVFDPMSDSIQIVDSTPQPPVFQVALLAHDCAKKDSTAQEAHSSCWSQPACVCIYYLQVCGTDIITTTLLRTEFTASSGNTLDAIPRWQVNTYECRLPPRSMKRSPEVAHC